MINIKSDSRKVKKGDIFIAIKGLTVDGHGYINEAIKKGASKLIVEKEGDYPIEYEIVKDSNKYLTEYLVKNYSYIFDKIKIIGITGTNGKTTTGYLIDNALNKLNIKSSYIGTIGYYVDSKKVKDLDNTSPDICSLYELIFESYENGSKYIVIEASSQGLDMGRFEGVKFDYAIFTNLTQDHLDYHKTMDNYALAKQILFKKLKTTGKSIINYDDSYKKYYTYKNTILYGFNGGDYKIVDATYEIDKTKFKYIHNNKEVDVESSLLGDYNVYNLLPVIIILEDLCFNKDEILKTIKILSHPSGRMDTIKYKDNKIIIDYAHTPDAIKKVIETVKQFAKKNIYVVYGCTGDRDRTKRPIMTKYIIENTTFSIITEDDLHNESFNSIVNDMTFNMTKTNYEIIPNRAFAIERGISLLKSNDVLLILGKGHEEFKIIKDKKIPHNDRNVVMEILSKHDF